MDMQHIGLPLVCIYAMTTVGSIGGGWPRGGDARRLERERRAQDRDADLRMLRAADRVHLASGQPVGARSRSSGWRLRRTRAGQRSPTRAGEVFPKRALGAVVGIGGMAGSLGGVLFSEVIGHGAAAHRTLLGAVRGRPLAAYPVAFAVMHLLTPRMSPAKLDA